MLRRGIVEGTKLPMCDGGCLLEQASESPQGYSVWVGI
jgi:hypothetical protein